MSRISQICVNVMLKVVLYILLRRCAISSQNIMFHVILYPAIVMLNGGLRFVQMEPGGAAVLLSNCFSALVNGELTEMVEIGNRVIF